MQELNIRFNKKSSLHGYELNNITSINSATALDSSNGLSEKGIYIELDVNNLASDKMLDFETLLQMLEKIIPNFSPSKVKELVKQ